MQYFIFFVLTGIFREELTGSRGDGTIPERSIKIVQAVGQWLQEGGLEAVNACDQLTLSPTIPTPNERGDWDPHGRFTASANNLYYVLFYPQKTLTIAGVIGKVQKITAYNVGNLKFVQNGSKLIIEIPDVLCKRLAPVLKIECDRPSGVYRTGGLRVPNVEHPRYDPIDPDIKY